MSLYEVTSNNSGKTYELEAPENISETSLRMFVAMQERGIDFTMPEAEAKARTAGKIKQPTEEKPTFFDAFMYGIDAGKPDWESASIIAQAKMPNLASEARYGEDFASLSEKDRLQRINDVRAREEQQRHPEIFKAGMEDSGGAIFGKVIKSLFSPTTLLPIGQSYKAITGIGAVLGAEYAYLDSRSQSLDVEATDVAVGAAVGAVAAPVTVAAGRKAGEFINRIRTNKAERQRKVEEVQKAKRDTEKIQEEINKGRTLKDIVQRNIRQGTLGRTSELDIIEDAQVAGVQFQQTGTALERAVVPEVPTAGITPETRYKNTLFDNFIGSLSSTISRLSPRIGERVRQLDQNASTIAHQRQVEVKPFVTFYKKLNRADKRTLKKQLYNQEFDEARALIFKRGGQEAVDNFNVVGKVYDDIHRDLIEKAGYVNLPKLSNYWHRAIKDVDGLRGTLNTKELNALDKKIKNEEKRLRAAGRLGKDESLPEQERIDMLNEYLRGNRRPMVVTEGKLTAAEKRMTAKLTDERLDYYEDPVIGLFKYIDETTYDVERKAFFGGKKSPSVGVASMSDDVIKKSVGRIVDEEMLAGRLSPQNADEIKQLLEVRFMQGDRGANKAIQRFRSLGYMTTLTNPFSAIIQLGDIGVSVFAHGFTNTLAAMFGGRGAAFKGAKKWLMSDMGLDRVIAQEFMNERVMGRVLHKAFTISGFRHVDRFGKNTLIRASLAKGSQSAERILSGKAVTGKAKRFQEKYSAAYGDEYVDLVNDLANGKMTDRVKMYLWSELADMQPISLSEMPRAYLNNPNLRVLYMLKTYMTKQLDLLRKHSVDEFRKGNKAKGLTNALAYMMIVPTGNAGVSGIKDALLKKEVDIDTISDSYVDHIFKTFGASEYMLSEQIAKGRVVEGLVDTIAPPLSMYTDLGNQMAKMVTDDDPNWEKVGRHFPVAGRAYYYWIGDGLKDFEDWQKTKD